MAAVHGNTQARERIIVVGSPGCGKTYQGLTIAAQFPEAKVYWIDTDDAVLRTMIEFGDLPNVEVLPAWDWRSLVEAGERAAQKAQAGDWVVIDMLGPAWDWVQEYFVGEIHGQSMDNYFLQARRALTNNAATLDLFSGWLDWPVIKKLYQAWWLRIVRTPAHLYATSGPKEVGTEDSKELRQLFGSYGVRPAGEKHAAHSFHTVLMFGHPKPDVWTMTTIKDRGRPRFEAEPLGNFAQEYLLRMWRTSAEARPRPEEARPETKKTLKTSGASAKRRVVL